jgi:hypothetical protein
MLEQLCDQVDLITHRALWSGESVNPDAQAATITWYKPSINILHADDHLVTWVYSVKLQLTKVQNFSQ